MAIAEAAEAIRRSLGARASNDVLSQLPKPADRPELMGASPVNNRSSALLIGQIEGGTVRALAVSIATRSPTPPDVPTVAEQVTCGNWFGLGGPGGTDPRLVAKIRDDVAVALKDPIVIDYLAKVGSVAAGSTPQAFEAFMRADKWAPLSRPQTSSSREPQAYREGQMTPVRQRIEFANTFACRGSSSR